MSNDKVRKTGLRLAGVLTLLLFVMTTIGGSANGSDDDAARPQGVHCEGFRFLDGIGPVCPAAGGLWEVFAPTGESLGFTHGGDPVPADSEAPAYGPTSGAGILPKCVTSTSDHHVVVIYAHAYNDADRWASLYWDISDLVVAMNTHLRVDAGVHDTKVDFKVRCNTVGSPHVYKATLPTAKASASFSTIVSDLRNMGYNAANVKYIVWYDDTGACTCGGMGNIYNDDRKALDNRNNGYAAMYGVTFGYLDVRVVMHENGHNMGAVQLSAPHTTGAWHCTDGYDMMCYNDGGSSGNSYSTSACRTGFLLDPHCYVYDCRNDDYFHPAPATGSYLDTKWNVGWSGNRFLAFDTCGLAREGILSAPGFGIYVRGVSWYTEADIPVSCWGKDVALEAISSGDFDLCFYNGSQRISCLEVAGDEYGTIPTGTTDIRVYLYYGANAKYVLYMV